MAMKSNQLHMFTCNIRTIFSSESLIYQTIHPDTVGLSQRRFYWSKARGNDAFALDLFCRGLCPTGFKAFSSLSASTLDCPVPRPRSELPGFRTGSFCGAYSWTSNPSSRASLSITSSQRPLILRAAFLSFAVHCRLTITKVFARPGRVDAGGTCAHEHKPSQRE